MNRADMAVRAPPTCFGDTGLLRHHHSHRDNANSIARPVATADFSFWYLDLFSWRNETRADAPVLELKAPTRVGSGGRGRFLLKVKGSVLPIVTFLRKESGATCNMAADRHETDEAKPSESCAMN